MSLRTYLRIAEFATLPPAELRALASGSHVVCIPPGRPLVSQSQPQHDYLYLLRGSIEISPGAVRLRARPQGPLGHFYPGCVAARSLTHCQVLRVNARQRDFILQRSSDLIRPARSELWLQRFLTSHMMRQLTPGEWQRVIQAFRPQQFRSRQRIVQLGDRGMDCYVVEQGHAVVHDEARTLCHLNPGDFFGEDALLLEGQRNAHVTALSPVRLQAIPAAVFVDVLVKSLIRFVPDPATRTDHCPSAAAQPGYQRVVLRRTSGPPWMSAAQPVRDLAADLDPGCAVYVSGGSARERALAAFILIQQGFTAHPVAAARTVQAETVEEIRRVPSDCVPSPAGIARSLPAVPRSGRFDPRRPEDPAG